MTGDACPTELEADDYLEADTACEALAACEVLARLQGRWGKQDSYTEDLDGQENLTHPQFQFLRRMGRSAR